MTQRPASLSCVAWLLAACAVHAQGLPSDAADCIALAQIEVREPARASRRLGELCPRVAEALRTDVWGESLAGDRVEDLTASAFLALAGVVGYYEREASGPAIAVEPLAAIVGELQPFEVVPEPSLWDRIMQWLQSWLGGESQGGSLIEWLRGLEIPERWSSVIVYTLGTTVVLAALLIVFNELRHAGVLARRFGGPRRVVAAKAAASRTAYASGIEALDQAPAARQPALLLTLILDRLRKRYAGLFRDSLTHRELITVAERLEERERMSFHTIATAAERATFGGWEPEAGELETVRSHGLAFFAESPVSNGRGKNE